MLGAELGEALTAAAAASLATLAWSLLAFSARCSSSQLNSASLALCVARSRASSASSPEGGEGR